MAGCPPVPDTVSLSPIENMGIGLLGDPDVTMKRKYRWLFSISVCNGGTVPPHYVRTAARPSVSIEETEINFLNEKTWVPGKAAWDEITITYLDVAVANGDGNIALWSWLATVYDYTSACRHMASKRSDYSGTGTLVLYDGCGNPLEQWIMADMWPKNIKFGDLAYDSNDFVEIELTCRYSQVTYTNMCGPQPNPCPCTGCG